MVARCKSPQTAPDFFPVYQTANYGDPDNIAFAAYHSANNGNWQNMVYKNPKVDELITKARAETDEAKRAALYKEFQQIVVDEHGHRRRRSAQRTGGRQSELRRLGMQPDDPVARFELAVDDARFAAITKAMNDARLYVHVNKHFKTIVLAPPLVATEADLREGFARLERVLDGAP